MSVSSNCIDRLAPEHPFPIGLNDSFAALKWVRSPILFRHRYTRIPALELTAPHRICRQTVENAASLGISVHKALIVGGDSAGANLATVVALLARDDPFFSGRPVTGQLLRQPSVIHPDAYPEKWVVPTRLFRVH